MPRLTRTEFVDLCVIIKGLQTKDLLSIQERVNAEVDKRKVNGKAKEEEA
jgi:ribosomal silencing factor RsfS